MNNRMYGINISTTPTKLSNITSTPGKHSLPPLPKTPSSIISNNPHKRLHVEIPITPGALSSLSSETRSNNNNNNQQQQKYWKNRNNNYTPRNRRTPSKTPKTPRQNIPATPSAIDVGTIYIVALCEWGRKRQEVGLAAINLRSPSIKLYQFPDNQTYTNTIQTLNQLDPSEILIPDTQKNSTLITSIEAQNNMTQIIPLRRKYFAENEGWRLIQKYSFRDSQFSTTMNNDSTQYLSVAACSCLLQYVERICKVLFAPNSLNIEFCRLEGRMQIDAGTVQNLELVHSLNTGKSKNSLLAFMGKYCRTHSGYRLLRQSLMQPLNDRITIETRLNALDELLNNEDLLMQLMDLLVQIKDLDHTNSIFARMITGNSERETQNSILSVVNFVNILHLLPKIGQLIETCENVLLQTIAKNFNASNSLELLKVITSTLDTKAAVSASSKVIGHKNILKLVFCVQSNISGLLDVARSTYCDTVEDIHKEAENYLNHYKFEGMRVEFTNARGFHLSVLKETITLTNFPHDLFIQRQKKGKRIFCTTEHIISMDDRRRESYSEILFLTSKEISKLYDNIRIHLPWLHSVSESIALLDMFICFANVISLSTQSYVKPEFPVDHNIIAVESGRHPIVESLQKNTPFVGNDIFITTQQRLQIVTGPNNAGKSVYLRQVALITIMAQIGCYIPAKRGIFRLTDQIATRLSLNDDIEHNASTFLNEMRETAMILSTAKESSLIIIDELGRGTSNIEGVGIAWAVCEELLKTNAFVLFATHFLELTDLIIMYPTSVNNISMSVKVHNDTFKYEYAIKQGPTDQKTTNYGLQMAKMAGFPPDLLELATHLSEKLREQFEVHKQNPLQYERFYACINSLLQLKNSSLDENSIRTYLKELKSSYFFN